ncbi:MAG: hypothetical protein QXW71_01160 [Thermoplasmata archaeon]
MTCKRLRENTTKNKLPLQHRDLGKRYYYHKTFENAWKYHLFAHNLQVPDIIMRRVIYDALFDAMKNEYGKVHKKDFLREYESFLKYWNENYSHLNKEIEDWLVYRKSEQYRQILDYVNKIERLDTRAQITIDIALAYMYAKYQPGWRISDTIINLERRLKLDIIPKVWSKKWLWFAAFLLVFDANSLYAQTIGNNIVKIIDYDAERAEAIKIRIVPWYERKDIEVSDELKLMFKVYEEIIVPIVGEVGSVILAEAARQGTVIALNHMARAMTSIARYSKYLRGLKWGAQLVGAMAGILSGSILAWLGWQILVEWTLDGTIQYFMIEALKHIYAGITGVNLWKPRDYVDWGLFDLAIWYVMKWFKYGKLTPEEYDIIKTIMERGSEKQKDILNRIIKTGMIYQELYNFRYKEKEIRNRYKGTIEYWKNQAIKYNDEWSINNFNKAIFPVINKGFNISMNFIENLIKISGTENAANVFNYEVKLLKEQWEKLQEGETSSRLETETIRSGCPYISRVTGQDFTETTLYCEWVPCCLGRATPSKWCNIDAISVVMYKTDFKPYEYTFGNLPDIYKPILPYLFCADQYLSNTAVINLKDDRIDLAIEPWYELQKYLRLRIYENQNIICYAVIKKRNRVKKIFVGNFAQLPAFTFELIRGFKRQNVYGFTIAYGSGYFYMSIGKSIPTGLLKKRNFMRLFKFDSYTYKFIAEIEYINSYENFEHDVIFGCDQYWNTYSVRSYVKRQEILLKVNGKNQRKRSKRSKIVCIRKE